MRIFHLLILAYSLVFAGCGYKALPVWKDTPEEVNQVSNTSS